jgi:hypothetical protein
MIYREMIKNGIMIHEAFSYGVYSISPIEFMANKSISQTLTYFIMEFNQRRFGNLFNINFKCIN